MALRYSRNVESPIIRTSRSLNDYAIIIGPWVFIISCSWFALLGTRITWGPTRWHGIFRLTGSSFHRYPSRQEAEKSSYNPESVPRMSTILQMTLHSAMECRWKGTGFAIQWRSLINKFGTHQIAEYRHLRFRWKGKWLDGANAESLSTRDKMIIDRKLV